MPISACKKKDKYQEALYLMPNELQNHPPYLY